MSIGLPFLEQSHSKRRMKVFHAVIMQSGPFGYQLSFFIIESWLSSSGSLSPEVVESASDCSDGELKEESIVAVWAVKCR